MKTIHPIARKQYFFLSLLLVPFMLSAQSDGDSYDIPLEPMQFVPGGNYVIESGSAVDSSKRVQLVLKMDESGNLTVTRSVRDIDLVSPFQVYLYRNTQGGEEIPEDWQQWVILFDSHKVFEAKDVQSTCSKESAGMEKGIDSHLVIREQGEYVMLECTTKGKSTISFPPTIEIGDESYLEAALFVNAKRVILK